MWAEGRSHIRGQAGWTLTDHIAPLSPHQTQVSVDHPSVHESRLTPLPSWVWGRSGRSKVSAPIQRLCPPCHRKVLVWATWSPWRLSWANRTTQARKTQGCHHCCPPTLPGPAGLEDMNIHAGFMRGSYQYLDLNPLSLSPDPKSTCPLACGQ